MRRRVLAVFALVTVWCALGASLRATTGARTTADEPQYLMTAQSLVEDGDLDVADERAAGAYRSYHEVGLPLQEAVQPDGSRISPHDPGLPALLALPVAVGGWLGAKLALAAIAGLLAALLLFVAEVRLGVRPAVALPVVLAAALAAPLAVYGTQVYPEIVAATVVAATFAVLTSPRPTTRGAVLVVALVSALPWLSVKYAPVAAALGVVALVRRPDHRRVLVLAGAVGAVLFAGLHLRWYGALTPYAVGWHFPEGQLTVMGEPDYVGRADRLVGLLVDRDFGLAVWQPLLLALAPALGALVRRDRPLALLLGLPLAAGWLNATFVALTMHGWWFPGRQLVVVLPAVVLAIAWWAERLRSPRAVPVLWCAVALGASLVAWLAVQVLTTDTRLITTFGELSHPWWRAVRSLLPDLRADRATDTALLGVWTVALGASIVASFVGAARPRADGERSDRPALVPDRSHHLEGAVS